MKNIYTTIVIALLSVNTFAQAPTWIWAKSTSGSGTLFGNSIAKDNFGNLYVAGRFESSTITFGTTTLTNSSSFVSDIYLVKYDMNGNVIWAKSAGGTGNDFPNSVSTDPSGNILVAGVYGGPSILFGTTTLTNAGSTDIFVAKYDPNGNVIWAIGAGGNSNDFPCAVTTDTSGNVYSTGYFISPSITFGSTTLTVSSGGNDMYLVKHDPNGNALWAKQGVGATDDFGRAIVVDAEQNVLIAGYFDSPSLTLGSVTLSKINNNDLFIAKYDPAGTILWAKRSGSVGYVKVESMAIDFLGNLFMSGSFMGSSLTIGSTSLASTGNWDIFLAKFDIDGNPLFAKKAGGISDDWSFSVTADTSGNAILTGAFESYAMYFGTTLIVRVGNADLCVAKYDSIGNVTWAKGAGGSGFEYAYSVVTDSAKSIYVTGCFQSTSLPFGSTTLTTAGYYDMFLAKLDVLTGIEENQLKNNFTIAPNPFNSIAILTFDEEQKNVIIKITDVLGREINSTQFTGKEFIIEKNTMKSGIYFVTVVREKNSVLNKKIIIQ